MQSDKKRWGRERFFVGEDPVAEFQILNGAGPGFVPARKFSADNQAARTYWGEDGGGGGEEEVEKDGGGK